MFEKQHPFTKLKNKPFTLPWSFARGSSVFLNVLNFDVIRLNASLIDEFDERKLLVFLVYLNLENKDKKKKINLIDIIIPHSKSTSSCPFCNKKYVYC